MQGSHIPAVVRDRMLSSLGKYSGFQNTVTASSYSHLMNWESLRPAALPVEETAAAEPLFDGIGILCIFITKEPLVLSVAIASLIL